VKRPAPSWLTASRLGESLRDSWRDRFGTDQSVRVSHVAMAHAERLAEIHATAFARPWSAGEFEAFLVDEGIRLDGLYLGRHTQPAGFVVARCVLDEAEILSVALAREARGHSRPLLAYHLQNLAHAGIRQVHLEVEEGNGPALALYRRLGFVQCGTRIGYYARPDGTRADARSMSLDLA
jgi:ribosomal-protein-alanine N-acetyltransferase